jgi:hypothetical protein
VDYLKRPSDTLPGFDWGSPASAREIIREYFFGSEWWKALDLLEFLMKTVPEKWKPLLRWRLNQYFEAESAAYRFVGDEIAEITDTNEIRAIETALEVPPNAIRAHLSRALELLSDRKQPDHRNSIKESISAVEAASKLLARLPKATLGDSMKVLKKHGSLHPAFEQALVKLYNYSSDEGGIRHALTEKSVSPTYADAKFMLVACSAFINFLWTKAAEMGIEIDRE